MKKKIIVMLLCVSMILSGNVVAMGMENINENNSIIVEEAAEQTVETVEQTAAAEKVEAVSVEDIQDDLAEDQSDTITAAGVDHENNSNDKKGYFNKVEVEIYREIGSDKPETVKVFSDKEVIIEEEITDADGNVWYTIKFDTWHASHNDYVYVRAEDITLNSESEEIPPVEEDQSETEEEQPETEEETPATDEHACDCQYPPESGNLAAHVDGCARKTYVKSLFEGKTAEEIYAAWETCDENLRTDLLNMLQSYDGTKYEALKQMIHGTHTVDKETSVDGSIIQASGSIPEDVTLSAVSVDEASYNEAIYSFIEDKFQVLFAFDITLTNPDRSAWQPGEGESVTVTLDVPNAEDGDKIGILHEHEGSIAKLGEYVVEDGKITFETDGFSVFYGYTVDFEYNGTWHSIQGGAYIFLSDLFAALGIERDVDTVTNVVFSDPSLISVSYVVTATDENRSYYDWLLQSHQAFSTAEELTITFNDGTGIVLSVYDAQITSISGDMTWNTGDTVSGCTIGGTSVITLNGNVTLNGTIVVPDGCTLTIKGSGTIMRGSGHSGYMFNIGTGGKLIIIGNSDTERIIVDGNGSNVVATGSAIVSCGPVELKNANVCNNNYFSNSTATSGGGIRILKDSNDSYPTLKMDNCKITGNIVSNAGGGIYSQGTVTATNTEISGNYAMRDSKYNTGRGAGIYIDGIGAKDSRFTNVDVKGNTCMFYGAGIQVCNGATLTFNSGTISGNTAICGGAGGFHVTSSAIFTMNGGVIEENNVNYLGGAIHSSYTCTLNLNGGEIRNNKSIGRAGGISIDVATTLNLNGTKITGNQAISGNNPAGHGYPDGTYHATKNPNARSAVTTTDGKTYVINNSFTEWIDGYGGGIVVDAAKCNLISSEVSENFATKGGGGFLLTMRIPSDRPGVEDAIPIEFNMTGGKVTGNKTDGAGAGIYLEQNYLDVEGTPNFELSAGEITSNIAKENGGGIYLESGTRFTLSGDVKINNNEANNGGGIYFDGGLAALNGGTLSGNIAKADGGAFYVHNTSVNFGGSISVTENNAVNGAGFYIRQDGAGTYSTTISNGSIDGNSATGNGGGIYQTGSNGNCTVSGAGTISGNIAASGGGIYINGGSELTVNGGIITKNDVSNMGGGIYVETGSFTMSGTDVGLHSNKAAIAANDAYASGTNTTLTLPDVKSMILAGYEGTGSPEGWFADYKANDVDYPKTIIGEENPGRYNYYDEDKVEVEYATVLSNKKYAYYCLTIGTPHPGYGNLIISKQLDKAAIEDQTFLFEITGTTRKPEQEYSMTVALAIKKGQTFAQVKVANIPDGTYTVTENSNWSWRYTLDSTTVKPKDGNPISENEFTVAIENPEWEVNFVNSYSEDKWLSGDAYSENIFD